MSFEQPFSPLRAPHNDEGGEGRKEFLPPGAREQNIKDLSEIEDHVKKVEREKEPSLPWPLLQSLTKSLGISRLELLESLYRSEREEAKNIIKRIRSGATTLRKYVQIREAVAALHEERAGKTISIQDVAKKAGIKNRAMVSEYIGQFACYKEDLGISDMRLPRTPPPPKKEDSSS